MSESKEKSRKAGINRQYRQDNLREYMRGAAYVRVLEGIAGKAHLLLKDDVPAYSLKAKIYLDLLAKVLPDLRAVEHSGTISGKKPEDLTDDELARIASSGSPRDIESPSGEEVPSELH